MQKILILKSKTDTLPERKTPVSARVVEYGGHSFFIQGNAKTGYFIGDLENGMLIAGADYETLKEAKDNFVEIAEKYLDYIQKHKEFYQGSVERFERAAFEML